MVLFDDELVGEVVVELVELCLVLKVKWVCSELLVGLSNWYGI